MPYSAEISRADPAYFIILLDQSGSMNDPFGGEQQVRPMHWPPPSTVFCRSW